MVRWILLLAALGLGGAARADGARSLVGRYASELAGAALTLELRADGTAALAGEQAAWSVRGNRLVLGDEAFAWRREGSRLLLTDQGGTTTTWLSLEGEARGAAAPGRGAPPAGGAAASGGGGRASQLRQLLLSSAWCSFTYNQRTGVSQQARAVFQPDGALVFGAGAESYSSGHAGTVAGQSQGGEVMRWRIEGERLLVDAGQGFQDVGLQVNVNSAGHPILTADGREYARCR